jgi:hypothetical protein
MHAMSQQPEPTPQEEDASLERQQEEEAQRGAGHEDPEKAMEPVSDE